MSKIKTNNKIFITFLALVIVMSCLASVSAGEIGNSDSTVQVVGEDSLAVGDAALSDIEQTDGDSLAVEKRVGDSDGAVLSSAGN